MKRLQKLLIATIFIAFIAAPVVTVAIPQTTFAQAAAKNCDARFLGMPAWYRGLTDADCNIVSPASAAGGLSGFIWHIVLNVIEIGLFLAGYVALFFLLYGGFQFLTGGANPGQTEKARVTLLNAVIGLAIAMAAIAGVNLIYRIING